MTTLVQGTTGAVRIDGRGGIGRIHVAFVVNGVAAPPVAVQRADLVGAVEAECGVRAIPTADLPTVPDFATAHAILSQYDDPAAVVGSILAAEAYFQANPPVDPGLIDFIAQRLEQAFPGADLPPQDQLADLIRTALIDWQSQQGA